MRHGSSNRRQRGNRGNGGRRGNQGGRSQVFDSNGPDVRIRGTAHQVAEKYIALAKDAAGSGDPIAAESYLQHAEHYQRIINSWGDDSPSSSQGNNRDNFSNRSGRQEEDLSLPASILGAGSDVNSENRVAEEA